MNTKHKYYAFSLAVAMLLCAGTCDTVARATDDAPSHITTQQCADNPDETDDDEKENA